jgi:dynein heavy chain
MYMRGWSSFRRLLLVRALTPARTAAAVQQLLTAHHGEARRHSAGFDMAAAFALSAPLTPLVCIHAAGASPVEEIALLARRASPSPVVEFIALDDPRGVGEAVRR